MLKPEALKAKPADNYDDLKRQFLALKNLCESKFHQCDIYSKKLAEYDRESVIARNEALESEREMNAQLTEELAKANERIIKLEASRDHSQRMYNSLLGDVSAGYGALSIPECEGHLRKFAIEREIKGLKDYQALCGFSDCRKSINARIEQLEEKLRKEQE